MTTLHSHGSDPPPPCARARFCRHRLCLNQASSTTRAFTRTCKARCDDTKSWIRPPPPPPHTRMLILRHAGFISSAVGLRLTKLGTRTCKARCDNTSPSWTTVPPPPRARAPGFADTEFALTKPAQRHVPSLKRAKPAVTTLHNHGSDRPPPPPHTRMLILRNAGFISSAVGLRLTKLGTRTCKARCDNTAQSWIRPPPARAHGFADTDFALTKPARRHVPSLERAKPAVTTLSRGSDRPPPRTRVCLFCVMQDLYHQP